MVRAVGSPYLSGEGSFPTLLVDLFRELFDPFRELCDLFREFVDCFRELSDLFRELFGCFRDYFDLFLWQVNLFGGN